MSAPDRLARLGERAVLAEVLPLMRRGSAVGELVGPGDDAAVLAASGSVVATTDSMVRGLDWRDEWSTGADVGHKVVAQNLADIAAMGATPTGLLVALAADPQTPMAWVRELASGIGEAAAEWETPVVGGDLSGAGPGVVVVAVTALGDLHGAAPVLRSGARPGDVVAVADGLGRSGAGLLLLQRGEEHRDRAAVAWHRRPRPPLAAGPGARALGATAMIDVSDGLVLDAGRVASAGGVRIDLSRRLLEPHVTALRSAVGAEDAWDCVLTGGEEHALVATFPAGVPLAAPWRPVGVVVAGSGVTLDGAPLGAEGWDHFG